MKNKDFLVDGFGCLATIAGFDSIYNELLELLPQTDKFLIRNNDFGGRTANISRFLIKTIDFILKPTNSL